MRLHYLISLAVSAFLLLGGCAGKSNNNDAQPEQTPANVIVKSMLEAEDLIRLQNCSDASCVQLFMKKFNSQFFYPKKGEYVSVNKSAIFDSTRMEIIVPLSTVYFSTDPGADWRITQIIHNKELSDELINDFAIKKFTLIDSFFYHATKAMCYQYASPDYPQQTLYFSTTYSPWSSKGMYLGSNWLCYVFEMKIVR